MSMIKQALAEEIKEGIQVALALREQIKVAKTNTKKEYLHKKLIKNNKKVASMIEALEKLDNKNKKEQQYEQSKSAPT